MSERPEPQFGILQATGIVTLALQAGLFARIWSESGLERAMDTIPFLFMATVFLVRNQRRLDVRPANDGAAGWLAASRTAALALLALGTLGLGYKRLVPDAQLDPALIMGSVFVLMWAVIALKGRASAS